jgi:peptidoglycan/LPS O-acetylase OafA/YrhL
MSGKAGEKRGSDRFLALDSIRGILACTIVIYHMPSQGWLWTLSYIRHGMLAVTFFFVLSGFVIGNTYGERLAKGFPISRFLGLRLGRIYPLHLFMIGVLIAWQITRLVFHMGGFRAEPPFMGHFAPSLLPYHVALLQKFGPILGWNDPSWSIGVEWWTYVAFAAVAVIVGARSSLITAAILIVPWALSHAARHDPGVGLTATFDCMMSFGLGLIVCEARRWKAWRVTDRLGRASGTAVEIVAVAIALWMIAKFGGKLSLLIAPTFALVLAVFSLERGLLSRLLMTAPCLLLGELSYSIYMIHHFILDRTMDLVWGFGPTFDLPIRTTDTGRTVLVGSPLACDLLSISVVAMTVGCSLLSYRYVEKKARLWSRRILNPDHSEKVVPRDPPAAF